MEPSKEPIAVRITRLNRQILGKVTSGTSKFNKRTIDREALLDALTALYDECNEDPVKKSDELVRTFVDKYRSTLAELRRTRVCLSDFEVLQTIGRGYFGEVHMVREKQTGDVYALKTLRKEQARRRVTGAEDEREVLATSTSPWIPRLQYAFQDVNSLYLVMELCSGGDLANLLARHSNPLSERDAAFYVAEIAHALKALHGLGYVHRDVKPHNILLDRCGHVKLADFGSCARLSDGGCGGTAAGTADYAAPELLAAADCAARHARCIDCCRGIAPTAISACDYWSLGVIAFELVTLKRPFSANDDDSIPKILSNIQKYERDPESQPPFDPVPSGPSGEWRLLVSGLLRVSPSQRYNYLDTLQHPALSHLSLHAIRDQAPPWVPSVRGAEDPSYFAPPPRPTPPPSAAPFRARPPFAGQLPFIGYTYVAPDEHEDSSGGFNASHDCTAIDLATFKSAEKLAAMRGREIASLQSKLAAAEATAAAEAEKTRRTADAEAERTRAKLQAEITALTLQNRRLERQIEVEKEERMALQRSNQELSCCAAERSSAEVRAAQAQAAELQREKDALRSDMQRLEERVAELQDECKRAMAEVHTARAQHKHYKEILKQVQELRHRRLTEINVRAIDSIAKERALRRQTLTGGDIESRELTARATSAEANATREARAREHAEKRLETAETENATLHTELDELRTQLAATKQSLNEKQREAASVKEQLVEAQTQLTQENLQLVSVQLQVQELQRSVSEAERRESALEEQSARTEARFKDRLNLAEARTSAALQDDVRHREKVKTLEQLVRQLERQVSALETRDCPNCGSQSDTEAGVADAHKRDAQSDTESVGEGAQAQLALLKEQLERAETQLQARADEIATLRQEARSANLARWRKEREFNELSIDAKATARDLKRIEERLKHALEARREAEKRANELQKEIATLRPQYERASEEVGKLKQQLERLQKAHETAQAEVDRSRNDIRKLKSELQYSEKRRLHAEEQEELSSRERAQLRDELTQLRTQNNDLVVNNKALQEACSLLEEQLTDLEKLADYHEFKNKELENETQRMRSELSGCRERLAKAEGEAASCAAAASLASASHDEARERERHAHCQLQLLGERLENREARVLELESRVASLEGASLTSEVALQSAARRMRDLQEECASLRTRAHEHHSHALQLQAQLADAQEETSACREAAEAAAAWWRTRETKASATLRQQAKLIDFLQAKLEEAGRKKCSLSNKLFGRSGRRPATSPTLRRANRELREEVEQLRAKLAALKAGDDVSYPPTPRREKPKPKIVNGTKSIDTPDSNQDSSIQVVWSDGSRERYTAQCADGALLLTSGDRELRARLLNTDGFSVPQNETNRAFTIKLENGEKGSEATAVCSSIAERALWVSRLAPAPPAGYVPGTLCTQAAEPHTALCIAHNVVAIGCSDGLHSLRGAIRLEWASDTSPPRATSAEAVTCVAAVSGRALVIYNGILAHGSLLALGSALRRASNLRPTLTVTKVCLPETTAPHLIKVTSSDATEASCAAVACGRRVFLLRFDAANIEFRIVRSLTVDRPPGSLLITTKALYIAGEKALRVNLPSGALEAFAMEDTTVAAAAKRHSPPKAILLVREKPVEMLLCYMECGVFVDENGKRTRNEDPKWSSAVHGWEYVSPFLYVIGEDRVVISYLSEDAFRAPPCTCDATSLTSTESECYTPEMFTLKIKEPKLLGTAPNGIIIRSKIADSYSVSIVDGMAAFRSVGASMESLSTISDMKNSTSDLAQSLTDLSPQNDSHESVEASTGFLADIRKRAKQLRNKNRKAPTSDEVITKILTTEVGLKRTSTGRKSPATISEFDSDTENEDGTESTKNTSDLCAEMFTRQVLAELSALWVTPQQCAEPKTFFTAATQYDVNSSPC